MKVARYNYTHQFEDCIEDVMVSMRETILSGAYGVDGVVEEFERRFAVLLGVDYVRGVNTGTDALQIALSAVGVRPGDEVITQANTFNATVAAICLIGATPVLVDARIDTFLMDERQIESAITPATRALVPVHLFGKPTPMSGIVNLCHVRDIALIEDAAQAHGAQTDGHPVGTHGDAGCFSFHPSKNLASAGDGGAVVTNDPRIDGEVSRRRALGQARQNEHLAVSPNSRLQALQAIVLQAKLPKLARWNEQRRQVASWYRDALAGLPVEFQEVSPGEDHVFHLFQIRVAVRDQLLNHLREAGVDAVVRYPVPIHLQPAFAERGWMRGQFPVAEQLADELLCLPIRPDMTLAEVEFVSSRVRSFFSTTRSR